MPERFPHPIHFPQEVGTFVEDAIGHLESRYEAPVPEGLLQEQVWYRIPLPDGLSGDGSEYHIYVKKAPSDRLCVFLSGGGMAWNAFTEARPVTGGKVAAGLPNYYWNNLRPFTQIMNIHTGITEIGNPKNPFDDWNFIVITYATGDLHIGDNDFPYTGEDGTEQVLHFPGHRNFRAAMQKARSLFPAPERLLIAGDSAGGFAVPALADEILKDYYPDCREVTLLSDSSQLYYRRWKTTARDVWKADPEKWECIRSNNLTVDWYRHLYGKYGDRLRYLYAGSVRDYLLSAYYNDVTHKVYSTDAEVQEQFFRQMRTMVRDLKKVTPAFGLFIYDFRNLRFLLGGTVHTAVRQKRFYFHGHSGISMAEWLGEAEKGNIADAGLPLLM